LRSITHENLFLKDAWVYLEVSHNIFLTSKDQSSTTDILSGEKREIPYINHSKKQVCQMKFS